MSAAIGGGSACRDNPHQSLRSWWGLRGSMNEDPKNGVELPASTAAPLVLGLGIALVGVGLVTSLGFSVVGAVVLLVGLGGWIRQLLSVEGHVHEPLVEPGLRPAPTVAAPGTV